MHARKPNLPTLSVSIDARKHEARMRIIKEYVVRLLPGMPPIAIQMLRSMLPSAIGKMQSPDSAAFAALVHEMALKFEDANA